MRSQITGEPVGEVKAVSGMHQRKAEMARQADAFIALPGKLLLQLFHSLHYIIITSLITYVSVSNQNQIV